LKIIWRRCITRAQRIVRLEKPIDDAIGKAPAAMQTVVAALQALRGVAKLTAVVSQASTPAGSAHEGKQLRKQATPSFAGFSSKQHGVNGSNRS